MILLIALTVSLVACIISAYLLIGLLIFLSFQDVDMPGYEPCLKEMLIVMLVYPYIIGHVILVFACGRLRSKFYK